MRGDVGGSQVRITDVRRKHRARRRRGRGRAARQSRSRTAPPPGPDRGPTSRLPAGPGHWRHGRPRSTPAASLSVGDELGPMEVDLARIDVEPDGPTYTADAKGKAGEAHVGDQLANEQPRGRRRTRAHHDRRRRNDRDRLRRPRRRRRLRRSASPTPTAESSSRSPCPKASSSASRSRMARMPTESDAQRAAVPASPLIPGGTVNRVDAGGTLVVGERLTGIQHSYRAHQRASGNAIRDSVEVRVSLVVDLVTNEAVTQCRCLVRRFR